MSIVKKYFVVAKDKIVNRNLYRRLVYNGKLIIIDVRGGKGYVQTECLFETLQNLLRNLGLTVYVSENEYRKKLKKRAKKEKKQ